MEELAIDAGTQAFLDEKAHAIRARLERTTEDVIAIGLDLIAVKERLLNERGYGHFGRWIQSEFGMSHDTANNFMNVARRGDTFRRLRKVPMEVLYELASPMVPETVIEAVQVGDIPPTLSDVRAFKQRLAEPIEPQAPSWAALASDEDADREFNRYLKQQEYPTPQFTPSRGVPAALQSSDSNEWYTPGQYTDAARELMGAIDLDPASNIQANTIVQARTFYSMDDDGFTKPWHGRVFLNPPYGFQDGKSNQERWSQRLLAQYAAGVTTEAVLLVNANTEAKWFHPLYDYLICLTDHRIRFYNTQDEASQPTQGNAFVYLGNQRARFIELFSRFGVVIERAR